MSGPRRLRRTPAHAPAGRPRPAGRPGRAGAADVRPGGPDRAAADRLAAGRRAAHPRLAAQGGGRGGAGRRRRAHALRRAVARGTRPARAASTPTASSTSRSRDVVAEVGDATVVMSDLCLDEFTSHGHCGVLAADGSVDNDATLERLRPDGGGPGRGRGPHGRTVRDDGRPGRRRAAGAGRGRVRRRGDPGLRRQVRLGLLRPVPRGGGVRAGRATAGPTSRTRRTCARPCARSPSTWPRAPTSSW